MKFKLSDVSNAVEKLYREMYGWERSKERNDEVEINFVAENPGAGQFVDCMVITAKKVVEASSYVTEHEVTYKLEIFAGDNSRPPRITKMQTEEIVKKE